MQVVEVLRSMSHRDELADAIHYNRLGQEEVAALGRVLGTLPREERSTQFWIDISNQVGKLFCLFIRHWSWQLALVHTCAVWCCL